MTNGFIVSEDGGTGVDYEKMTLPEGQRIARCFGVIHCGRIPDKFKQEMLEKEGKGDGRKDTLVLLWETEEDYEEGGKKVPMIQMKEYSFSISDKANLGKDLVSWRGRKFTEEEKKAFDVSKLIGLTCIISTERNGTFSNLISIMGSMKNEMRKQVNDSILYTVTDHSAEEYNKIANLSNYGGLICKKIESSKEFDGIDSSLKEVIPNKKDVGKITIDDVPF